MKFGKIDTQMYINLCSSVVKYGIATSLNIHKMIGEDKLNDAVPVDAFLYNLHLWECSKKFLHKFDFKRVER